MSEQTLKIAFVSSEVAPFAKTGGLADVSGALPVQLAKLGHQSYIFMPAYQVVLQQHNPQLIYTDLRIPVGRKTVSGNILKGQIESDQDSSSVDVFFIDEPEYFGRPGIYNEDGKDYADNCERFVFFCRAVMEAIRVLDLSIDVMHTNDWQTGLIPAYMKTEYKSIPPFENVPAIHTIHNLAYQGIFWQWDMLLTGLDWKYFNWQQMEFYGNLNLLKTGIVFADQVTTVSPTYAEEIQTDEHGCGLQGTVKSINDKLTGIMNGIDDSIWNPLTDPHLAQNYDLASWQQGKLANKTELQKELGLEQDDHIPLVGLVGRLASQKGWSILYPVIEQWLDTIDVQWVILGTGDPDYENALRYLAQRNAGRISAKLEFSDRMAHRIEAASDIFLMPSQYEPCGLNQLYSLKYGTVPVVRKTGGLADSITDASEDSANGFVFDGFSSIELETALARAIVCHMSQKERWSQLVETGMQQDWSWKASASKYVQLYHKAIADFEAASPHSLG